MIIPSPLIALLKTSIMINRVLVPGRQVANNLQRFCRPVCFFNEGSAYQLSWAGSCFLFRYRSHNLAFCTKHQLVNKHNARTPGEFCIIIDDERGLGKIAITPNQAASISYGDHMDYGFAEDIQFVEYDESRGNRNLSEFFVDIDFDALPDLRAVTKEQLVVVFAIGYPSDFASYDFDLDDDFVPQNMEITHRFSKLLFSNNWTEGMEFHLTLCQYEKYPKILKDLDGFSGSPVFFVFKEPNLELRLGFAGMIRLGGNGIVHVYEAAQLKKILNFGFPSRDKAK